MPPGRCAAAEIAKTPADASAAGTPEHRCRGRHVAAMARTNLKIEKKTEDWPDAKAAVAPLDASSGSRGRPAHAETALRLRKQRHRRLAR